MNKLKLLIDTLDANVLSAPSGWEDCTIQGIFASDLISDILIASGDNILLLTSLLSEQVLRSADMIGAAAVVLVNRQHIPSTLAKTALKQGLPLFYTPLRKFEACVRLGRLMESA